MLAGERLVRLPAGGGPYRPIAGTQGAFAPVFSPDGQTIAFARIFFAERGKERPFISASTWLIDADGGTAAPDSLGRQALGRSLLLLP